MNDKKIIILKCDACGENLGEIEYIKFLDDNNKAYIYDPLLAPRYLKCYLEENNYVIGYAITDEKIIKKYEDKVYTFIKDDNFYYVFKGIAPIKKRILLVNKSMNTNINLPRYNYEITDKGLKITPRMDEESDNFCYVEDEDKITDDLKNIMLPVLEIVPGYLSSNNYNIGKKSKRLSKKKRKN